VTVDRRSAATHGAMAVTTALIAAFMLRGRRWDTAAMVELLAAAFVSLAAVVVAAVRWRRLTPRSVLLASGALLVLAVAVPPITSGDIWSYAMYGRIAEAHHASPYTHLPAQYRHDPYFHRVSPPWRHAPSVYGPLFTGISAAGMWAAGGHPLAARLFFQGLAALAVALALLLVHRRTHDPVALAAIGLNPFVVVAVVNGGHNDALVGLAILAGVLLGADHRPALAGLALGLAALIKVPALFPLAAVAVWIWRPLGLRAAATAVVGGVVLVGAGYGLAGGSVALRPVEQARLHISAASPWDQPRVWLTREEIDQGLKGKLAGQSVRRQVSFWAGCAVAGLALVIVARRRRDATPALAAGGAVLAYTLLGPYVLPWYLAWGAFVLAIHWRSSLAWLAMAQATLLTLAYVPDRYGHLSGLLSVDGLVERVQTVLRDSALPVLEVAAVVALLVVSARSALRRAEPA
jgi:Glycosyltransferase family 87